MTQKVAYLDCHSGISGSMLLAAFLDAGLPLDALQQTLETSSLHGYCLQYDTLFEKGIRGSRCNIFLEQQQPDYYLSDVMAVLHTFAISPYARERAVSIFRHLAEAEATIQGVDIEAVHFEATEAIKTIIVLVGVTCGMEELGISQLYTSLLPLTNGHVQTRYGFLPVPRPVTLELLRRVVPAIFA